MAKLQLTDAMQQYLYGTTGVNNLSFVVENDSFAVFGGEEAGKTSLLEMLAGNREVYRGTVAYNDKIADKNPGEEFSIVYIRQRKALFLNRSVRYNLAYPLKIRGFSEPQIADAVFFAMKEVGLDLDAKRRVRTLHAADCARLKLARCFLRQADFIFVDDVICGLDDTAGNKLLAEVYPKIAALGGVKIFAFRKFQQLPFCTDGAVLAYGITEQVGKIADFYNNPQTLNTFSYTHAGVEVEEGSFLRAQNAVIVNEKKVLLQPDKIAENITDKVLVAADANGITKLYSYPDEKLVYFD